MFALLLAIVFNPAILHDHCDLVELNSFHDCNARHVYDQVIFYEWAPDEAKYHVRAWVISDDDNNADRRPTKRYSDGLWVVKWTDSGVSRVVTATHYRRSWSQIDPERENKKILPEHLRYRLVKRTVEPVVVAEVANE